MATITTYAKAGSTDAKVLINTTCSVKRKNRGGDVPCCSYESRQAKIFMKLAKMSSPEGLGCCAICQDPLISTEMKDIKDDFAPTCVLKCPKSCTDCGGRYGFSKVVALSCGCMFHWSCYNKMVKHHQKKVIHRLVADYGNDCVDDIEDELRFRCPTCSRTNICLYHCYKLNSDILVAYEKSAIATHKRDKKHHEEIQKLKDERKMLEARLTQLGDQRTPRSKRRAGDANQGAPRKKTRTTTSLHVAYDGDNDDNDNDTEPESDIEANEAALDRAVINLIAA